MIAGAVAANSVQAAPVGLAVTVTVAAAKGTLISATLTTLVKGTMKTMTWLKIKFAAGVGVAALLAGGAATVAVSSNITNAGSDAAAVVAFKDYLSHPPRIARLVYSESQTGRRFIAAVDGESFIYREIKAGENPDLPISDKNKMRSSTFVGQSGETRWQIVGFNISKAVHAQPEKPDAYTAFADSSRIILNEMFGFSSQMVEPGSFTWSGNKFEARLGKVYKNQIHVEPPLLETVSGSIKVKHGNVIEMDSADFGTATYEYDSAAHLPLGIPSRFTTANKQTYIIHELVLMDKEDARPEIFRPETYVATELASITVVSNSQQTVEPKANKLATEVIYRDLKEQKAVLQKKSLNRRVMVVSVVLLVAAALGFIGFRLWRRQ